EYSLIFGDPRDSEKDFDETVAFAKKVKRINPEVEIIVQTYVPVPQRSGEMYGNLDNFEFPTTVEEWATDRWFRFAMRKDPELSWLTPKLRRKIRGFETVMNARWPTVQDWKLPEWSRLMLKGLGSWRYAAEVFENPVELRWAQKIVRLHDLLRPAQFDRIFENLRRIAPASEPFQHQPRPFRQLPILHGRPARVHHGLESANLTAQFRSQPAQFRILAHGEAEPAVGGPFFHRRWKFEVVQIAVHLAAALRHGHVGLDNNLDLRIDTLYFFREGDGLVEIFFRIARIAEDQRVLRDDARLTK